MRVKKKLVQQLTIFDSNSIEDEIWLEFKPIVDKLHKQKLTSIDESWWRSRYHEDIICPNYARNPKGFEYEQKATIAWKFIWAKHKTYMCKY